MKVSGITIARRERLGVSRMTVHIALRDLSAEGVLMRVKLHDEQAVIPDLAAIEARIAELGAVSAA